MEQKPKNCSHPQICPPSDPVPEKLKIESDTPVSLPFDKMVK